MYNIIDYWSKFWDDYCEEKCFGEVFVMVLYKWNYFFYKYICENLEVFGVFDWVLV